jgi:hypothetical protein
MKIKMPGFSNYGWDAFREAFRLRSFSEPLIIAEASRIAELTTEMEGFRSLSGARLEEIPWKTERIQNAALSLWQKNHMARRLLEIPVDFVVGDGVTVVAQHNDEELKEQIQGVIDGFWNDPINGMRDQIENYARETLLWGEICMPRRVREIDGKTRLGWICPLDIEEVKPETVTGEPGIVIVKDSIAKEVGQKELQVIRYIEDQETWTGECFFYSINRPKGRCRGTSELYSAMIWIDIMEQTMLGQADRAKLNSSFNWDVLLKGMNEVQIKDWLKTNGRRPKPNEIRAHNEFVEWKTVQPELASMEFEQHIKTMLTFILGGYGYPNHWFGSGSDANLATRKALRRKQKVFGRMIGDMVRDALIHAEAAGKLPAGTAADDPFDVQVPDLSGPDIAKTAIAIQGITSGVIAAEEAGLISHDTAMNVIALALSETGIEIDPAKEREQTDADALVRQEKDDVAAKKQEMDLKTAMMTRRGPQPPFGEN